MATDSIGITKSLSARTPGSSILPDGLSDGSVTGGCSVDGKESTEVQSRDEATINILPDDALLEIFHFYRELEYARRWWWKNLTDVCRRWRDIIFGSPHSLDVQIFCTDRTPTRSSLDIWPPLPITILCHSRDLDDEGQDNIIAALEHHYRVIKIDIRSLKFLALEKFSAVTNKPFPVLRDLGLTSTDVIAPVLHEKFLRGSPRLLLFFLWNIAFPVFPKFAMSATHLSTLFLGNIPIAGYISPEAMASCLTTLPNLRDFSIGFESPRSRPDRIGLPPTTRAVLPALTDFGFQGVNEYLEDLVARIDTPNLDVLVIDLFMDFMFHVPQLHEFISRAKRTRPLDPAKITFSSSQITINLGLSNGVVILTIRCEEPDWQASLMAQRGFVWRHRGGDSIDPTRLLELFHPFLAVTNLRIYHHMRPLVAQALQILTVERAAEVLPALRTIFFKGPSLSGSIREDMQSFIVARQHSDHPVDVHWK
ncbi:hypothetical protein BJV74DRAFT_888380 [Russula compacta]|nr:hypothetical protein BJV74DRAFT_888380 [Russula compacta]